MHYFHTILVNLNIFDCQPSDEEIRNYAEEATEEYYGTVYDWRETDTAGRWQSEYPNNVLRVKDNPEKAKKALEEVIQNQLEGLSMWTNVLNSDREEKFLDKPFKEVMDKLWEERGSWTNPAWALKFIGDMLAGNYTSESMYYNILEQNSILTEEDIEEILKEPEKYALVFFDIHN